MQILKSENFTLDSKSTVKLIITLISLHGVQIALFPGPTVRVAIQLVLFALVIFFYVAQREFQNQSAQLNSWLLQALFLYSIICAVRGAFEADTYVQLRYLVTVFLPWSTLPLFAVLGSRPDWLATTFKVVFSWFIPLSLAFIVQGPGSKLANVNFFTYVGFVLPLLVFAPVLSRSRAAALLALALISFFFDLSNRANAGSILISITLFLALAFLRLQTMTAQLLLRLARYMLLAAPIVLLFLGWSGAFNIFKFVQGDEGAVELGNTVEIRTVDSRTPIYEDAYYHLLSSGDWIFGSSPTVQFETNLAYFDEDYKEGRVGGSESSFLAVVTYGGLFYVAIIAAIFWKVTHLAIYSSNSSTLKVLGIYLSFRWIMMFVENPLDLTSYWVFTFLLFGCILSPQMRAMSDEDLRRLFGKT